MSVLIVRPRAEGGLAAHVEDELSALAAAGVRARIAPVSIRERPDPVADARTVHALGRALAAEPTTALHAHGLRAGGLAALVRRRGARLVVTLHNRPVGSRAVRAIGAALLRLIARRADVVLAVSPDLAEDARRAGARDVRAAVIPVPEAIAASSPPPDADGQGRAPSAAGADEPLDVLVLARLAPQKDLDTLLDAVALARAQGACLDVRIAGEGPLRDRLQARIDHDDLPVRLLGRRSDVPALLGARPLVVSSARWEGQPVGLQEALRAGCPIIATDAGGTRWVTGEAAVLVPVGDAPALAAALRDLQAPHRRRERSEASVRRGAALPGRVELTAQLLDVLGALPRSADPSEEDRP